MAFFPRSLSLLLICTASLSLAPSALAAGLKGVKTPTAPVARRLKKIQGPKERDCNFSEKDDEVEFQCKSRSGGSKDDEEKSSGSSDGIPEPETRGITITPDDIKDEIKYKVKTAKEGIRVKLEYKNEIETQDVETETKSKFELLFENLVEYVKVNDNGMAADSSPESQAYDWETDEIIQTIPLTNWDSIPGVVSDEAGVVSYFTANTSAGTAGGSVAFNFTVSRAEQGEKITANSMKIDVRIVDFPWQRTDSYVALLSTLESKTKVKMEYEDEATVGEGGKAKKTKDVSMSFGDDMQSTLGFNAYGEYTWEEQANATSISVTSDESFNGTVMSARQGTTGESDNIVLVDEATTSTIEVVATSPTTMGNETYQSIAYSFVGNGAHSASDIYWDPEAGIGYESSAFRSVPTMMGIVGSVVGAMLAMIAF